MKPTIVVPFLVLTLAPATLAGQTYDDASAPVLSEADEIALARSAAPARVSGEATIMVARGDRYAVAEEGSNGNTCLVARSQELSLEPICYDREASVTILPIELRRFELRRLGASAAEIDARIETAIEAGELRAPSRPAMAYMMSPGQILYNDEGERVGRWMPHLHVYYPHLRSADVGLFGDPAMDAAVVADEGTPTSSIVIAVREFTKMVRDVP